jgi:hypothetical protein
MPDFMNFLAQSTEAIDGPLPKGNEWTLKSAGQRRAR